MGCWLGWSGEGRGARHGPCVGCAEAAPAILRHAAQPPASAGGIGLAVLATCALDQWALDFAGNLRRVAASAEAARAAGATYRVRLWSAGGTLREGRDLAGVGEEMVGGMARGGGQRRSAAPPPCRRRPALLPTRPSHPTSRHAHRPPPHPTHPSPLQVGPELELTGYGCEDHFLEADTEAHAWRSVAALLAGGHSDGRAWEWDGGRGGAGWCAAGEAQGCVACSPAGRPPP